MYVTSGFFGILIKQFENVDVDISTIFADFKTDIQVLESPLTKMDVDILGCYLEKIVAKTKNTRVGLEIGFVIPFILSNTIFNSYRNHTTLRELFAAQFDFSYPTVNGINEYTTKEEGDFGYYEISTNSEFAKKYPIAAKQWTEMQFGIAIQYAYSLFGRNVNPVLIHTMYSKEGDRDKLMEYFDCPVKFEQEKCALIFHKEVLDMPIMTVNRELLSAFEDYMNEINISEKQQNKCSASVRRYIMHSLSTSNLSLETIAQKLNMSKRNLHRKLKEEGTSYQQLLDSLRMDLSRKYLKEKIPLIEIAFLLGFESQSAFNKFFQKHFHIKPSQFR